MAHSLVRGCVVIGLVVISSSAAAQSSRAGGPTPGGDDEETRIAADGAITGNLARGFVNRELISARAIVQGWTGPWGLYIQPYWLYGRVDTPAGKITTDNEIYVRTGLFRTIVKPFFAYAVNVYDRSVRRQIEHRNLAGGGGGLTLVHDQDISINSSVGVLGELTDFGGEMDDTPLLENGSGTRGIRETIRWSVRIYGRFKLAGGRLNLIQDLIVVPSFRDPADDYRILFYGAIDAPIAKGFSVRLAADATREGLVVVGTKHDDLVVTFGVSYKGEWSAKQPEPAPPPAPAKP